MAAHPPNLCPLCAQRALVLNTAGVLLTCTACGAQAAFDDATRRVRYTHVPQAFARLDGPLRGRWLTRSEVFDVVATSSQARIKRRWPWAVGLALLGGVGVIGLGVALVSRLPAQPQARVGSTPTTQVRSVGLSTASAQSALLNTADVAAAARSQPTQMAAMPIAALITAQPAQVATAVPALVAPAPTDVAAAVLPTPTKQPQPTSQIGLPTINAQRSTPVVSAQPTSTPFVNGVPTAMATAIPTAVPPNTPAVIAPIVNTPAATPTALPLGSDSDLPVATPTPAPEQTPTETPVPTETPIPPPMQTPVSATLSISTITYVGGSTFEEYLELTNATDQTMDVPIHTWKLSIRTGVAATELRLGAFLAAPMSLPAGQSCRIYTSKRVASAGEASPCGFLTLGTVEDTDGLYPDKPGVTVTLVNGESQVVATFRY